MKIATIIHHSVLLLVLAGLPQQFASQEPKEHATRTRVVLLGTGTPVPDPDHSGPATAIVVGNSAYLVDFGPGVVRRAEAAVLYRGIIPLEPGNLKVAFVTHLHSDHTGGYSDLIFTGWTSGRSMPLEVYGPAGLNLMTEHILQAYRIDIDTRTNPEGNQRAIADGWKVNSYEIKPGVIYKDANVTVTAFPTTHAMESYGYRFDTPDRRIVISGDTSPTEETIKACSGRDVLIHDAQTLDLYSKMPERLHSFVTKYHTTHCTACGTCDRSQTQTACRLSHGSFPSWNQPSEIPVLNYHYRRLALDRRDTGGQDRLALFGAVRYWTGLGPVLVGVIVLMRNRLMVAVLFGVACMCCPLLRAQQKPDAIFADPPVDKNFPPTIAGITVPSHGVDMDTRFYLASGLGPHGTVLLLHGLPGYENNGDLAHSIQRAGWNVIMFHYRGTWGTAGTFSQSSAIEDTAEVVRFLRDPANGKKYRIDPQRLVVIGHSLGGFLAGYEASHDPEIRAVAMIAAVDVGKINADAKERETRLKRWETQLHPIRGATAAQLFAEADRHASEWDYVQWAEALRTRPVLLVEADDQNHADMEALAASLRQKRAVALEQTAVATDHSFSDRRIELQTIVIRWLEKLGVDNPTSASTQVQTGPESDVREALAKFIHAFDNLDWEGFRLAFADDATVFYPRGFPARANGRTEFEQTFKAVFEQIRRRRISAPYMDIQPKGMNIQMFGDIAIATFHLDDRVGFLNRRTIVLNKTSAGWKIVHLHASEVANRR